MIIAVDFDGVLCKDEFPQIGPPISLNISLIKRLAEKGHEIVLWTCRVEKQLEEALVWCEEQGLVFAAVNDNAPSNKAKYASVYKEQPRKIYADYYIDDHSAGYSLYRLPTDLINII